MHPVRGGARTDRELEGDANGGGRKRKKIEEKEEREEKEGGTHYCILSVIRA